MLPPDGTDANVSKEIVACVAAASVTRDKIMFPVLGDVLSDPGIKSAICASMSSSAEASDRLYRCRKVMFDLMLAARD